MKISKAILTGALALTAAGICAQTAEDMKTQITAAQKAAAEKNYKEVNFQLQQAMGSLSMVIGNEVLNVLPKELSGCKHDPSQDHVTNAAMMLAGTSISREYTSENDRRITVTVVANSPMVASLGLYLNNPMYTQSMGDNSQKIITVNGKRAIYKHEKDSKDGELQILSGQNLITVNASGMINTEADMQGIGSRIDIAKIDALIGN